MTALYGLILKVGPPSCSFWTTWPDVSAHASTTAVWVLHLCTIQLVRKKL